MQRTTKYVFCILSLVIAIGLWLKATVIQVPSGTWVPAGNMAETRFGAASVLLQDGTILVTGGEAGSVTVATTEFFNAGAFSAAPAMNVARYRHAAVVLSDSRVLVTGGKTTGGGVTNAAEIYAPALSSWIVIASIADARSGHTATLLKDGRVLLAGGESSAGAVSTLEMFDPVAGTFTFAGTMSSARKDHAAALLSDGRVLIVGGSNGANALGSTEIYDPEAGTLAVAPALSTPRAGLSATTLLNGKVLIAGGNSGTDDLATAEIFNPANSTFSPTGDSLAAARRGHLAFLLSHNNHVLIVGGTSGGTALATAELFRPWDGNFYQTGSLAAARTGATGSPLSLDGLFLVTGGSGLTSTELYGFATVKSDKDDYAPGEIVTITGSGWQPEEMVTLVLKEDPHVCQPRTLTAVADANGNIFNNQFSPEEHDLGVRFYLIATGHTSGHSSQTTFTDGPARISGVTTNPFSPNQASSAGVKDTATITFQNPGPQTACTNSVVIRTGTTTGGTLVRTFTLAGDFAVNASANVVWDGKDGSNVFLADGIYTARAFSGNRINLNCTAQNENNAAGDRIAIILDNTNPLMVLSPASGTQAEPFSFSWNITDPVVGGASAGVDVSTCKVEVDSVVVSSACSGSHALSPGGPFNVGVSAKDNAGNMGSDSRTYTVTAANATPTVTANDQAFPEGASTSYSASWSDGSDSSQTHTCTINFGDGTGPQVGVISPAQPSASGTCSLNHTYADGLNSYTITVTLNDGTINGSDTATATVSNVAPTAALGNNGPVNEGSPATVSFTNPVDPSSADTSAGFHYAFACDNDSLAGATYAGSGSSASTNCTFNDNGTFTVRGRILDKDGGFTEYTTQVTVNNAAPTATLGNNGPVDEGSAAAVSFTSPLDPSSADTAAGFHYAFACDNGSLASATYAGSGTSVSTNCTFNDNGTFIVRGRIIDKDGGFTEHTTTVTVNNVAPEVTLDPGNTYTWDESATAERTFSYTATDPAGTADPLTKTINCGSGGFYVAGSDTGTTFKCKFPDGPASPMISISADDGDGGTDSATHAVVVNNLAPEVTLDLGNTYTWGESVTAERRFSYTATDPAGAADPLTKTINCGTGGFYVAGSDTGTTFKCKFPDGPASPMISISADDGDGGTDSATHAVSVNNVAPVVAFTAPPTTAYEGQTKTYNFTVGDPGDDTFAVTAGFPKCGFGGSLVSGSFSVTGNSGNQTGSFQCGFPDGPASPVVEIQFTDSDSAAGNTGSVSVTVNNVAPVIASLGLSSALIIENGMAMLSGVFTDPGVLDSHAVVISWGDGSSDTLINLGGGILSFAASHQYLDDDPTGTAADTYSIGVSVTDKDGASGTGTTSVTVNNAAPAIGTVTATPSLLALNNSTTVTLNFSEVGTRDTHSCEFSWDSLEPNTLVSLTGTGNTSCSASHTYTAAGVYTVGVTVTDDDTGSATTKYEYVVVYDPSAGFVTGGGWIQSPAGAYGAGPTLTGKANFGFVSKYLKGSNVPTGETEFQLHFATFNFHSTSYQWLVVSGARAQYKGTGKINGAGNYGFLLTATDGQINGGGGIDKFRIKIWDIDNSGTVVYDNVVGASEDIDAANPQAINGGSTTIHAPKK